MAHSLTVVVIVSDARIIERGKDTLNFHLIYDIHDGFTEPHSPAIGINARSQSLTMRDIILLLILCPYLKRSIRIYSWFAHFSAGTAESLRQRAYTSAEVSNNSKMRCCNGVNGVK